MEACLYIYLISLLHLTHNSQLRFYFYLTVDIVSHNCLYILVIATYITQNCQNCFFNLIDLIMTIMAAISHNYNYFFFTFVTAHN